MSVRIYSSKHCVSESLFIENAIIANGANNEMHIYSGGVAKNTEVNYAGYVAVLGGTASGTVISNGSMTVTSNGKSEKTKISDGKIDIYNGGSANNTEVSYLGNIMIHSGGIANETVLSNGGSMQIGSSGVAIGTMINYGGNMQVCSGGIAKTAAVNSQGSMYVSLGGIASNTVVNHTGSMHILSGGIANSTSLVNGDMYISGNGIANNTTVNYSGNMHISRGGKANDTVINVGNMHISSGGKTKGTEVKAYGNMYVSYGGSAADITVDSAGTLFVGKQGKANSVEIKSGGSLYVYNGSIIKDLTLSKGGLLHGFSFTEDMYWKNFSGSDYVEVHRHVLIYNSNMHISAGGVADGISCVNDGVMHVFSGGIAKNVEIGSKGSLYVYCGGMYCATLKIEKFAEVYVEQGGIIDFSVAERTVEDDYLINDISLIGGSPTYTVTVSEDQEFGNYKLAQNASEFSCSVIIGDDTKEYGVISANGEDFVYNGISYRLEQIDDDLTLSVIFSGEFVHLKSNASFLNWRKKTSGTTFVSLSDGQKNFEFVTEGTSLDMFGLETGIYSWQVRSEHSKAVDGNAFEVKSSAEPQRFVSSENGAADLFIGRKNSVWLDKYKAVHNGFINGWTGTKESASLAGKNRIADVFVGSEDANVLVLTDDANGDALFVEDIYSALGDQARFSQIDEIRAGAGDDVIDMTSQKFEYIGHGVKIYGGDGDDIIWANSGENILDGDAGNDRIVGGSGNDTIIGGIGNDSLHGGGGNDTFIFSGDFGNDVIEQLSGGSITLTFDSGNVKWNELANAYTDGTNSVTINSDDCEVIVKYTSIA